MDDPTAPEPEDYQAGKQPTSPNAKNKTEAPTSGVTKTVAQSAVSMQTGLTETEHDFVNLMHQHYFIYGFLPTKEYALEQYALPNEQYDRLIASEAVRKALLERGVQPPVEFDEDAAWRKYTLTTEQLLVADCMLDMIDSRSYKKKLQDMGVSSRTYQSWLRDPNFVKYLDDNMQSVLKNGQHEAALSLMDKVQQGDLKAIQFYLEYTGRFISQSAKTSGNQSPVGGFGNAEQDVRQLVRDFVEIIVDEVTDHELASRIADRIKGLMVREAIVNTVTGTVHNSPNAIEQPEVVANRELTPAMEKTGMSI